MNGKKSFGPISGRLDALREKLTGAVQGSSARTRLSEWGHTGISIVIAAVSGFLFLIFSALAYQHNIEMEESRIDNEQVHLFIAEQVVLSAKQIELGFYRLAPAAPSSLSSALPAIYDRHLTEIEGLTKFLEQSFDVMIAGGVASETPYFFGSAAAVQPRQYEYRAQKGHGGMAEARKEIARFSEAIRASARELVSRLVERDRCMAEKLPCLPEAISRVREHYRELPALFGALHAFSLKHRTNVLLNLGKMKDDYQVSAGKWRMLQYLAMASVVAVLFLIMIYLARQIEVRQKQLRLANERIAGMSAEKTRFLSHMSHEIRSPLNGVIGPAQLLAESELSAHQKSLVSSISSSATMLMGVIGNVLDIAKIESGKMEFDSRPFSIERLLREISGTAAINAAKKGIEFQLEMSGMEGRCFSGDDLRIRQVLVNLVNNAIKFTERGGVLLGARLIPTGVRFEIADTGIGIPEQAQGRLFDSFAQANNDIGRRYGGTGLGLSICKKIAEGLGGRLGFRSRVGEGSTFWVEIPLPAATAQSPGEITGRSAAAADSRPASGRSRSVLIVEDTVSGQFVAGLMLEKLGHRVEIAASGEEAVAKVRNGKFDIVFMDLHMPGMSGIEAARAIRAQPGPGSKVHMVAMTAAVTPADRDACVDAGMNDFVSKPVTKEQLALCLMRSGI